MRPLAAERVQPNGAWDRELCVGRAAVDGQPWTDSRGRTAVDGRKDAGRTPEHLSIQLSLSQREAVSRKNEEGEEKSAAYKYLPGGRSTVEPKKKKKNWRRSKISKAQYPSSGCSTLETPNTKKRKKEEEEEAKSAKYKTHPDSGALHCNPPPPPPTPNLDLFIFNLKNQKSTKYNTRPEGALN